MGDKWGLGSMIVDHEDKLIQSLLCERLVFLWIRELKFREFLFPRSQVGLVARMR